MPFTLNPWLEELKNQLSCLQPFQDSTPWILGDRSQNRITSDIWWRSY
ncbi:hypothetical protein [Nostoc sp. 'Peltigera membranacea cyanobiont' 232]|nr:hypothetical protein [Nostoc sp. 'Peltigera membranacea cyanobiont' 232]